MKDAPRQSRTTRQARHDTGGDAAQRGRARRDGRGSATTGQVLLSERLTAFKRIYRWLNLTLIHQASWPLVLLITAAPNDPPEDIPWLWWLLRLAGPAMAAIGAAIYLHQRPLSSPSALPPLPPLPPSSLATQARFLLFGLPIMVLATRLIADPVEPAAKLALFGLADVAAFHLIHFGVVARTYAGADQRQVTAVGLFALSWAIRDALLTALGADVASPGFAFFGGAVLGLFVALLCHAIHRWPGGYVTAAAAHWLVVYLVFGFVS